VPDPSRPRAARAAQDRTRVLLPLAMGLWILWAFGFQTVYRRAATALDGTIVASVTVPAGGGPRHGTAYRLRAPGGAVVAYDAGPTDASLPRDLPVGTALRKRRWQLGYWRDGRWQPFPVLLYAAILGVGAALLALAARNALAARRR
jgi:hypothetical protein